jgi:hypothetical protein
VHCDWRANAVLRLVLDEIFGVLCFRNEIIWRRAPNLGRQAAAKQLGRVYDSILVYSKTEGARFRGEPPRRRAPVAVDQEGKPKGARWDEAQQLYFTTAPRGDYTDKSIARLRAEGRVYDSSQGKVYIKYFLTKGDDGRWYKEQPVDALWDDYEVRPLRHRPKAEAMGYDTQKPEGLLERVIAWATRPGDLVADFFCGSGTTAAVAQAMGRRWIACDQQRTAIEITRRRLLARGATFDVVSLGRGERRRWAQRAGDDVVLVLDAFGATHDHGRWGKVGAGRVYVGPLDEALHEEDIVRLCRDATGEVDVLAWEWGPHDAAALRRKVKDVHDVTLVMRTIPRDLMRGLVCDRASFLERPEIDLQLEPNGDSRRIAVRITHGRFLAQDRLKESKSNKGDKHKLTQLTWSDYIDTWRVDFVASESSFAPTWQATREGDEMALVSEAHRFDGAGRIRVKVLTVFGEQIDRMILVTC